MRGKILKAYEGSQYRYDGSGIRQEKRTSGEAVRIERLEKPETKYNFEVDPLYNSWAAIHTHIIQRKAPEALQCRIHYLITFFDDIYF